MTTRAKFKCTMNEKGQIALTTVYDPNPESENGRFFAATPSGSISLGVVNESAAELFEPGKEYYVDFSPATGS